MTEAEKRPYERVQAHFDQAYEAMLATGLNDERIADEYMGRAVFAMWNGNDDREQLRSKIHVAASAHIEALMHSIGEEPIAVLQHAIQKARSEAKEPSAFPEFDDPEFIARAKALHEASEKQFYTWRATADFEALIDRAIEAGRAAYDVAPQDADDADRHRSWVSIDLGQHHNVKPLILALQARDIGELLPHDLTYLVSTHDFLQRTGQHARAEREAIEAFAMALSAPGFEMQMFKGPLFAEAA